MSCRTINGLTTTHISYTSLTTLTHSSLHLHNTSLQPRTRCSVTNLKLANHLFRPLNATTHVGSPNNKLKRGFKVYASFLELPLLPFPSDQVLVPSEAKTLHLFEARYLKLLDEVMRGIATVQNAVAAQLVACLPCLLRKKKLFVHFVLDPIAVSSTSKEASFAARYACLVVIEKVEQLDVGALVSIRGIGRVTLVKFAKADPFLEGIVLPLQDNVPQNESEVSSKVLELKEAIEGLNSLEIKLKAAKDEPLMTQTSNSLNWATKEPSLDCEEAFIPSVAERISFAALQIVSGSTHSEMLKLQNEKLKAMDIKETLQRLETSLSYVKNNVSMTAAKLAIQSLNMQ